MKRFLALTLGVALLLVVSPSAQITVPNTFVAGTTISSSAVNTNFTTLANHALDRLSGGNIAGNVTADALVTIDGVDIGVQACTTCTPTFAKLTLSNTSATALTVGGGLTIGTGVVALVTAAGQITDISSTTFASLSGANLTGLNGSNISSGTIDAARLPSGIAPATTAKSGTYSAVAGDFVLATGTFTVTLPAAASNLNAVIDVKNVSTGTITVGRTGGDTIDGATSQTLSSQYQSFTFVSDGTNWWIR